MSDNYINNNQSINNVVWWKIIGVNPIIATTSDIVKAFAVALNRATDINQKNIIEQAMKEWAIDRP